MIFLGKSCHDWDIVEVTAFVSISHVWYAEGEYFFYHEMFQKIIILIMTVMYQVTIWTAIRKKPFWPINWWRARSDPWDQFQSKSTKSNKKLHAFYNEDANIIKEAKKEKAESELLPS